MASFHFPVSIPFIWLLIVVLFLLGVLVFGLSPLDPALVALAILLFALGFALQTLYNKWKLASQTASSNLTAQVIQSVPPRSSFTLVTSNQAPVTATSTGATDTVTAANFRAAASALQNYVLDPLPARKVRTPLDLNAIAKTMVAGLDPSKTVPARIQPRLNLPASLNWAPQDPLQTILFGPMFTQPLSKPLVARWPNFYLPGYGQIPANSVLVLQTNPVWEEAFMVGANYTWFQIALFNGLSTDSRFSSFLYFKDKSSCPPPIQPDINPIYFWPASNDLGENGADPALSAGQLVLLICGNLLRRYPIPGSTAIFAAKVSQDSSGNRTISSDEYPPVFTCTLPPNISLLGFNLTSAQVTAPPTDPSDLGYYFIIQQHPSTPKFGLETADWTNPAMANFLSPAGYLKVNPANGSPFTLSGGATWPPTELNASNVASITLRDPVQVAYNAKALITPASPGGA